MKTTLCELKSIIKSVLSEKRVPPVPPQQLVKSLKAEAEKLLRRPEVWGKVIDDASVNYTSRGKELEEIIDEMYQNWLDTTFRSGKDFIVVNIKRHSDLPGAADLLGRWMSENIRQYAERRGWFVLMSDDDDDDLYDRRRRRSWKFVLSPNYGERVTDVPSTLYHVTSAFNVPSILRRGLIPRSAEQKQGHNERSYKPRIYVTGNVHEAGEIMASFDGDAFLDAYAVGQQLESDKVILVIDASKLNKGTKFYVDPEMKNFEGSESMWTYSPIPASAVSVMKEFQKTVDEFLSHKDEKW